MQEITHIPFLQQVQPYFQVAEQEAKKSPCIRRQYGAVIAYQINPLPDEGPWMDNEGLWFDASHNKRISTCCKGKICARDRFQTKHGGSVEIGAEIHAETSLMISRTRTGNSGYFILVGYENGEELYGTNVYPCHSCAMAIKFGGFTHILLRNRPDNIQVVSLNEIMDYRIAQWEPVES